MRALVTGAAGFIGSNLSEALLDDGVQVAGVDCFNDNYDRAWKWSNVQRCLDHDHFDLTPLDLSRGNLTNLCEGVDVIFHLAGEPGVRASWGQRFDVYLRNNLLATQQLLEAAVAAEVGRVVYASSSSVYGDADSYPTPESALPRPHSPYGVTKLAAEQLSFTYLRNRGLPVTALRYFSVYGPRQRPDMAFTRFCLASEARQPITIYGDGEQVRDFTFVADVVRATCAAATAEDAVGKALNIGGGSAISLNDAIRLLENVAGTQFAVNHTEKQAGDVRRTGADTSLAAQVLSFEPRVSLAEGLARQLDWARGRTLPAY